ncbi:hypothetical protein B0T13DRAFT_465003 [Neurospora crassa]|nr:hypothetical protein B0T13DRAFT_465003 [Neurospora crassa]
MAMAMATAMDHVALLDRLSSCAWYHRRSPCGALNTWHSTAAPNKTRHLELPLAFRCQFSRRV